MQLYEDMNGVLVHQYVISAEMAPIPMHLFKQFPELDWHS